MGLFSRKEPMVSSDLRDITRGLHEAASSANSLIAQQYIKLFDQFFDYDPDDLGTPMRAKMVEVALDAQHYMQVPLITLVAPRGLALETMNVDLSVKVTGTEAEAVTHALENGELNSERFYVTLGGLRRDPAQRNPDEVQISLTFKACDPPEAVQRLLEEYTQLITPLRRSAPQAAPLPDEAQDVEHSGD
ncbi:MULTISPECIES: DUF2589 domain-containing protein [Pseudomonas]|uniref:DUF2589 domain-containing protein n=1 Tax=Pseudomonas quercus TaxID=2722792 RepID=A0ABX0Y801_9PSED|nr:MULTISPECIES: DUF2589 domain-containing protein [Pseudomonas]NJO99428.1 DUF2589 domain-containing protein [Pseudomonas quercus]